VEYPRLELKFGGKNKDRNPEIIEVAEFIGIKSYKARGKRLSNYEVKVIQELLPENEAEEVAAPVEETAKKEAPKAKPPKAKAPKAPKAKAPEAKAAKAEATSPSPESKNPAGKKPVQKKAAKKPPSTKSAPKKPSPVKQDPDEVPMEVIKPKEEKKSSEDDDQKDPGGQFTLEW